MVAVYALATIQTCNREHRIPGATRIRIVFYLSRLSHSQVLDVFAICRTFGV